MTQQHPDEPAVGPRPRTPGPAAEPPTITGAFDLPTMTGGVPVLEDAVLTGETGEDIRAAEQTGEHHLGQRTSITALVIAVLTTLGAIGPLATDMYTPAFPQVTSQLGTTPAMMQVTLTAFFLGTAGGQVVAGPLSDRLGRRLPLIIGILLCLAGSIGCALAPSIQVLLVARVVQGIGGGFGMVLGRAVLIDIASGPELFRTLNIMQGIGGVAPIVAPLFGGLIMAYAEWRAVFWGIAAMSFVSLVGVLTSIPESLPREARHSGGFRTFASNALALLKRRRFTAYALTNAFSAFALMAYVSASSFVAQDMLHLSPQGFSIMFAINSTGMMSMSFLSAKLSRAVAPRTLIACGLALSGTAVAALLLGATVFHTPAWIVYPAFFFLVAAQGLIFGNGGALASREALDMAGTGSAMLGLGFSFAASLAAPLVGLAGKHSSLPMALTMLGGVLISVLCFVIAGRGQDPTRDA